MKKVILAVIGVICICGFTYGQRKNTEHKPLEVGDTVPDITLTNLINYPNKTAKLSDFKGKLLVLDFWTHTCGACVASWPKLIELQQKFKEKLQIILVNNYWNETNVEAFVKKREKLRGLKMSVLPIVCGDTKPKQLFPHNAVPHIVLIGPNGTVYGKTFSVSEDLNEKNIQAILDGKDVIMSKKAGRFGLKISDLNRFDSGLPLFLNGNGAEQLGDQLLSQSVLTKADGNYSVLSVYPFPENNKDFEEGTAIFANSSTIPVLYAYAYKKRGDHDKNDYRYLAEQINFTVLRPGRIEFEVENNDFPMYNYNYNNEQVKYNYQLTVPTSMSVLELQKMMQLDLQKYFGLKAHWEKRKKECLVFSIEDTSKISHKGKVPQYPGYYLSDVEFGSKGQYMHFLISRREEVTPYSALSGGKYPILDETGIKGRVSFKVEADVGNYKALDKALQKKYGMRFTLEEREVEVLVIKEVTGREKSFVLQNPKTENSQLR